MSFTKLSSAVPIPTYPIEPGSKAAATDSTSPNSTLAAFASGQTSGVAAALNTLLAAVQNNSLFGGAGYGVMGSGLTLSVSSGLLIHVAAGTAMIGGSVELTATTSYTLPDNQGNIWVWLKSDGTIAHTLTTTPPTATSVLLGWCATSGGIVVGGTFDYSGVCYVLGGGILRNTADTVKPSDAPAAGSRFYTKTPGGLWHWDGTAYTLIVDLTKHMPDPSAQITVSTTPYQLLATHPNVLYLDGGGSDRTILLPANPGLGVWFEIYNIGTSHSLVLKDPTGVNTLATLTHGKMVAKFRPSHDTGSVYKWPDAGSLTPADPPTPGI